MRKVLNEELSCHVQRLQSQEFPGNPAVRTQLLLPRAQVRPLVGEVRSHKKVRKGEREREIVLALKLQAARRSRRRPGNACSPASGRTALQEKRIHSHGDWAALGRRLGKEQDGAEDP